MSERTPDGSGSRPGIGGDLVIPVLAIAFAAYFFTDIDDLDWEAAANGIVVGIMLVGLCVIQIALTLAAVARGQGTFGLGRLIAPVDRLGQRIGLVVLLSLFVATIGWLGATLSMLLLVLGLLALLGVRDWRGLLLMPLGIAAVVYLLFVVLLQAKLPHGPLEKLLSAATGLGG
jgi:hypothetical protein